MRLQRKTLLITSVSAVFLFSIVFVTSAIIVWNGFATLERKDIQDHADHLESIVDRQVLRLRSVARKWALWDEWSPTNAQGVPGNAPDQLDLDTLISLEVDLVLLIDQRGRVVVQQAVDRQSRQADRVPASLAGREWVDDPLTRFNSFGHGHAGVLALPEGPLLVATEPARRADSQGRGTLLVGKWLRASEIQRMSNLSRWKLSAQFRTNPLLHQQQPAEGRLSADRSRPHFRIVDRETAEAQVWLNDPFGQPAVECVIRMPRNMAAQGRTCIINLLVGLLAAGVGFALVVRRIIDQIVLKRLLKLVNDVRRISSSMDSPQVELEVTGNDELADLAVAVNEMARDLCLIRDVSATANAADEKTGVALQTTLDRIATIRDWPVAHAFLVDSDGHAEDEPLELWNRDLAARFQPFRAATTEMCRGSDRGLIDRVVDSNQSVWVSSIEADTHCVRRDIAGEVGIQTAFAFPIRVGTKVVAVVEMFSIRAQRPNGGIIRIAEQIGSQIARVFERNRTARELERLHKQLADSAHREGMAEVATSVLHNVGNVLNSVNVSAALVRDIIEHSEMRLYRKAIDLLESHLDELSQYIEQDPKGRHLPRYLLAGARRLDDEFRDIDARVTSLEENIDHIKNIIAMQQAYARVRGNQQFLSVAELLDDALHLLKDSFAAHRIEVVRRYDPVPQIEVDRHRLMQIINNLLKNALESMTSGDYRGRRIEVCVGSDEEGWVRIEVRDNGEGIGPEHLGKIFSYGFTTKETGHGFGLHGCANAVKEMGGVIRVHSDGVGKGASFTIRLPVVLEGVEA